MNWALFAVDDFYRNPVVTVLALAVTLTAAVILTRAYWTLRDSTLVIPWLWAVAAFGLITSSVLYAAFLLDDRLATAYMATHYLAACGTLCPFVALIGAKRPQHAAWSFVIIALWCVFALPAAEVLLLQPGQLLEVNSFRSWFLLALLLAELCSFLFTRYALSCLLLVVGQVIWLADWLPWGRWIPMGAFDWELMGLLCAGTAIVTAQVVSLRQTRAANEFDRLWFDFRDAFGLFWSLRLIERVNDTAQQAGWDFDLGWSGFRTKSKFEPLSKLPPETETALRNCLQGLLRRFVSREWIAQRLGGELESATMESTP